MLFVAPQTWGEYTRRERGQERRREYHGIHWLLCTLTMLHWTHPTQTSRDTLIRSVRDLFSKLLCHFLTFLNPLIIEAATKLQKQKPLAVTSKYLASKIFKSFSTRGQFSASCNTYFCQQLVRGLYFCIRNIKVFLPRVSSPLRSPPVSSHRTKWCQLNPHSPGKWWPFHCIFN